MSMPQPRSTPHRLALFSDAVSAVIITVLVLELHPPQESSFQALLPLWPTALSYATSYRFIAIVWVNHDHHHHTVVEQFPAVTDRQGTGPGQRQQIQPVRAGATRTDGATRSASRNQRRPVASTSPLPPP
jgi:hypothetical protein